MSASTITPAVTLYEMARLYVQTFPGYNREIIRVLKIVRKPTYSDRSDTLGGQNPQQIVKEALDTIAAHRANKNNPHQETVRSIGILNESETKALLVSKLPAGLIHLSAFGYDYKSWADVPIGDSVTRNGKTITIKPNLQVLMGGSVSLVSNSTVDLSSISSTWNTTEWFLYIRLVEGTPVLEADTRKFTDTVTRMYIGRTGAGTNTVSLLRVIKTGKYRVSTIPVGTGMAVGLGTFSNSTGIDPRWVPSQNVTQPALPPKVEIALDYFDRNAEGIGGYIEFSREGLILLQVNVNNAPNIFFRLDGDNVTTTSRVEVLAGGTPTVTRVSNTQYRVNCATYSLAKVTITASIPGGDTATYSFFTEHRTNLGIWLANHNFTPGTYGGTTKLTTMVNETRQMVLGLTGDGVTTSVSTSVVTGGDQITTKVNETTYTVSSSDDTLKLYTFKVTDKYGRSTSFTLYVEVRKAFPPRIVDYAWYYRVDPGYKYNGFTTNASGKYLTRRERYGNGTWYVISPAVTLLPGHQIRFSGPMSSVFTNLSGYLLLSLYTSIGGKGSRGQYHLNAGAWTGTLIVTNDIGETLSTSLGIESIVYRELRSCFTFDSNVLMADNSSKLISEVKVGDTVLTVNGPQRVWGVDTPVLGEGRKLLSFNGKCKTSDEHSFWSKDSETNREFWATRNLSGWQKEAECDKGPNFDGILPIDLTDVETEYEVATIDGWDTVKTTVEEELSVPDLQLYNLRLEGGGSYFVDGYLVSSMCTIDCDVDWEKFKWDGKLQPNYPVRETPWTQSLYSTNSFRHTSELRAKRRNRNK